MRACIALDIGGTKIRGGLVTPSGKILKTIDLPTQPKSNNKQILDNIKAAVLDLQGETEISGIGVGLAGHINADKNTIIEAGPNFQPQFKKLQLAEELRKTFRVRTRLDNDANLFTLGEALYGTGKAYNYIVGITLGTGIGGGLVKNGKLIYGTHYLAGEFGQMFTRGNTKTWEKLAAGPAFNRHRSVARGATLLAEGFHNLLNIIDPDIIVVGGGLAQEPKLLTIAISETRQRLYYTELKKTPIIKAKLGNNATLLGAMHIVIHN